MIMIINFFKTLLMNIDKNINNLRRIIMIDFIVIFIILALVVCSLLYRTNLKKKGKSSCGCDCKSCPSRCNFKDEK